MQEPADDGVEPRIVDLIDIARFQFGISSLPSNKVPRHEGTKDG